MKRNSIVFLVLLITLLLTLPGHSSDEIRKAQQKLQEAGLYHGAVDGIMGSRTAAALRRFQLENQLKVTGQLNRQTLHALGISPAPTRARAPDIPSEATLALAELFSGGPFSSASPQRQEELYRAIAAKLSSQGLADFSSEPFPSREFFSALRSWQRNHQLRSTGRIDPATARSLNLPAR